MANKILYELVALGFAFMFVGAFSYDFSKPVNGLGITGLTVGNVGPDGGVDDATCTAITGWAKDPNTPDTAISVHVYRDRPAGSGVLVGGFPAAGTRVDVGAHGFNIPTPDSLKDIPRKIYVYGIDSTDPVNGPNRLIGEKTIPSCGTCRVRFTSNVYASFRVFKTDGSESHDSQRVNVGGTTAELALPSGEWDMRLQENDPGYNYVSVTPRGAQNCSVGGSVIWTWKFMPKVSNLRVTSPAQVNYVRLQWESGSPTGCDYKIYRRKDNGAFASIAQTSNLIYSDTSLSAGAYQYYVTCIMPPTGDIGGYESAASNTVTYQVTSGSSGGSGGGGTGSGTGGTGGGSAPPPLPEIATTHELQLKAGWNLVSTHVKQTTAAAFTSFQHNCNFLTAQGRQKPLIKYSNANNRYEDANTITNSKEGFWIGVAGDCSVRIRGDDARTIADYFNPAPELRRGWNFVGGIPETKPFNDIKGTCTFARGPFWWNPTTEQWETPANMEPGKGYIIGVNSNCRFAAASNPPTQSGSGTTGGSQGSSGSGSCSGISGSITCKGQSGSCNFNSGETIRIAWSSSGAESCAVNSAGSTVWTGTSNGYGTTPGNTQTFTLRCTRAGSSCDVASVTANLQGSSSGTCNNNDREEAGEECDRGDRNGPCPAECSRQCRWNRC